MTTPSTRTQRWVLALTATAALMVALDQLVVATALNAIRADLHASIETLDWTVNAYSLSFAVLLITGAALGDRYGRLRLFVAGLALFCLASVACALAPNIALLITARTVQGVGSALVMPLAVSLLTAAFPVEQRGKIVGIFTGIVGLAVVGGPVVGGAVTDGIAWQWIFWINVPIGAVLIPLALRRMHESRGARVRPDLLGLALVTAAMFGVVWGLVRADAAGWTSAEVLGALLGGGILALAFVAVGIARAGADAADAPVRQPHLRGRQRRDVPAHRVTVRRRVPARPVPADLARLQPARRRPALRPVDGPAVLHRAARRGDERPASAPGPSS